MVFLILRKLNQNNRTMKKNLTAFLVTIVMMVTGACLSYAAFPVASRNAATTVTVAGNAAPTITVQEQTITAAEQLTAHAPAAPKGGKSQIVAAILCFFLGGLGIHRFYLGYTWQGVVQLLTGGGCGIWALIDFIRILIGDLGPKDGKYEKTF